MYKIGILDQDEAYLWRLVGYLKEHHNDTFEINVAEGGFGLDAVDIDRVHYDVLFLGDGAEGLIDEDDIYDDIQVAYFVEDDTDDEMCICRHQSMEKIYRQMKRLCETVAYDGNTKGVRNAENAGSAKSVGNTENAESAKSVGNKKSAENVKSAGTATADDFVMRVIAENFRGKEAGEARQYLCRIRRLCDELMASLNGAEDVIDEEDDGYGSTEEFDNLRKNARESLEVKNRTKELGREEAVTYIIRKRTGEKVVINRNLFKMGKDASYVDYCVKDNPAVSRNHADIVRKPDGFYLVDKGSLNRTFVDGKKLEAGEYRKLEDGCLLQLADDVFEFRSLKN